MSVEPPMVVLRKRVCGTREQARELVASRRDVDPGFTVYVRADQAEEADLDAAVESIPDVPYPTKPGVEILTPSFAHELLTAWPKAQLIGANDDVALSWKLAVEHLSDSGEEAG